MTTLELNDHDKSALAAVLRATITGYCELGSGCRHRCRAGTDSGRSHHFAPVKCGGLARLVQTFQRLIGQGAKVQK
jgi:hypothetical protein